jgi:LmbE family N-acetylglucosaminyl deacetylase
LTNGVAGGSNPSLPRDELPRVRQTEQQQAAGVLGVQKVQFLDLPEGCLRDNPRDLDVELVRVIRQVRPQMVVS